MDIDTLSNGEFNDPPKTGSNTDISLGYVFRNSTRDGVYDGDYLNGYNPNEDFEFKVNAAEYDAYVDIIYDLGSKANINKVQHFTNVNNLTMGVYEVFASDDVNNLFDRNTSLVLSYQNKTFRERGEQYSCQQHEFAKTSARFVAFRIYCPVTCSDDTKNFFYNCLRIRELAIYGTVTGDYTVSSTGLETLDSEGQISPPKGTSNLLSSNKLTVSGKENGTYKTIEIDKTYLHDSQYGSDANCTSITGLSFANNGYTIERNDPLGNIKFEKDGTEPTTYLDFEYDLGDYYNVKQFEMYSARGGYEETNKTQVYRVYIGNDKGTLYEEGNLAAEYENCFNTSGQKITFNKTQIGKYLGVRILMGNTGNTQDNCAQIAEIAAFGNKADASGFTAPNSIDLLTDGIYNDGDGIQKTAIYLLGEYKTPIKNGTRLADATKIVLDDGTVADVKSRTLYVAAKSVYDEFVSENRRDEFGKNNDKRVKYVCTTGNKLTNYWKNGTVNTNENTTTTTYGIKVYNIKLETKDKAFAVRAKIVYTVGGKEFTVYSDTQTADNFSAQGAYDVLKGKGQQPPDWFTTGHDDLTTEGDDFFG